jgi:hypothetical protein
MKARAGFIGLVLLPACAVGAQAGAATRAHLSASCSGSITQKLAGKAQRASSIKTHGISCKKGKAVLKSFLHKAATKSSCRKAAGKPAPSKGCTASGYHCFLKRRPDYCASTSGNDVEWKLRAVSG